MASTKRDASTDLVVCALLALLLFSCGSDKVIAERDLDPALPNSQLFDSVKSEEAIQWFGLDQDEVALIAVAICDGASDAGSPEGFLGVLQMEAGLSMLTPAYLDDDPFGVILQASDEAAFCASPEARLTVAAVVEMIEQGPG